MAVKVWFSRMLKSDWAIIIPFLLLVIGVIMGAVYYVNNSVHTYTEYEDVMIEGKIITFKSDGLEYEFAFTAKNEKVYFSSDFDNRTTVKINEAMENGIVKTSYKMRQKYRVEKNSKGEVISKTITKTIDVIDSLTPVVLEMNTFTFKNGL